MFSLYSFQPAPPSVSLSGDFSISVRGIHVAFQLVDPQELILPSPRNPSHGTLERTNELWQHTCFEAFWSNPESANYLELNFTPSGCWNVYGYEQYRHPMPPRPAINYSVSKIENHGGRYECWINSSEEHSILDFSLCAILKTADQTLYFSTKHAGEKPDYHIRKSFTLQRNQT